MKYLGSHLLADAWQSPYDVLNDPKRVERALRLAVAAGGVTLIDICVHQFSPYGVTATATLAESHATVHTWPEHGFFSADFFFCGSGNTQRALETLCAGLEAKRVRTRVIRRGFEEETASTPDALVN